MIVWTCLTIWNSKWRDIHPAWSEGSTPWPSSHSRMRGAGPCVGPADPPARCGRSAWRPCDCPGETRPGSRTGGRWPGSGPWGCSCESNSRNCRLWQLSLSNFLISSMTSSKPRKTNLSQLYDILALFVCLLLLKIIDPPSFNLAIRLFNIKDVKKIPIR